MHQHTNTAGLALRGEIWHINKVVRVGGQRAHLRESTGCRTLKAARIVLSRRVAEVSAQLLEGPRPIRVLHTWSDAAAEYVADLEARGKSSGRCLVARNSLCDKSRGALRRLKAAFTAA